MERRSNCSSIIIQNEIFEKFRQLAAENRIKRLDEPYLQRFLVGHHYNVNEALKAMSNFQSFVDRRREKWLKLERSRLENILQSQIVDVLDKNGLHEQKIVWIRVEKWDPQIYTADEILEVSGLLCELVYAKTKGIKYIDVIIDLHNFSLRHLYGLSRKFAKRMTYFMSECLPMEMIHIYVVRQPKIFYLAFALYKPFIEDRMRKLIHICGYNYDLLTENIGSEVLPPELDGTSEMLMANRWLTFLYSQRIQRELKLSGYEFYDGSVEY